MFHVGEKFESYLELKEKISKFERMEFVQLNVQRSKSIEATRRRAPSKRYNENLKYSEINLACIHGGKKFKTTSKGERPGQW